MKRTRLAEMGDAKPLLAPRLSLAWTTAAFIALITASFMYLSTCRQGEGPSEGGSPRGGCASTRSGSASLVRPPSGKASHAWIIGPLDARAGGSGRVPASGCSLPAPSDPVCPYLLAACALRKHAPCRASPCRPQLQLLFRLLGPPTPAARLCHQLAGVPGRAPPRHADPGPPGRLPAARCPAARHCQLRLGHANGEAWAQAAAGAAPQCRLHRWLHHVGTGELRWPAHMGQRFECPAGVLPKRCEPLGPVSHPARLKRQTAAAGRLRGQPLHSALCCLAERHLPPPGPQVCQPGPPRGHLRPLCSLLRFCATGGSRVAAGGGLAAAASQTPRCGSPPAVESSPSWGVCRTLTSWFWTLR